MSKPKVTVTGKRFSRVETTTYPDDTPIEEIFKKHGRQEREGVWTMGSTFAERVRRLVEAHAAYLRSRGLPDAPRVYWAKDSEHWQTDPPARESFRKAARLEHYVIKELGYRHDSPEGIAASIIDTASVMESATKEADRMEAAFRLGELRTLAKVYVVDSVDHAKRGKKGANARWASSSQELVSGIIESLKAMRDELGDPLSAKELWPEFYSALDRAGLCPREIYHQSDPRKSKIVYDGGEKPFGTFANNLNRKKS